jgi:16S rRNA (cytosine967-C5)-methyltransferase
LAVLKPFQLLVVKTLLENYHFDQPFHVYFAAQAKLHRNWGSKDRKTYKNACYAYFRLGFMIRNGAVDSNVTFAIQDTGNIRSQIAPTDIFPDKQWVSQRIDFNLWANSLLLMRPVYLALKKSDAEKAIQWLNEQNIDYEKIKQFCLRVKADSKLDGLIEKGWAWIMDISSQEAANQVQILPKQDVWDACSGAGGKALFLTNQLDAQFNLTCSDMRFTVLENLKSRFYTTGLRMPHIELANLKEPFHLNKKYDKVILDVPCSGSGTWGRTPENISSITQEKITSFSVLQRDLVRNAIKNMKPEGRLYYMTCSVFKEENEHNVAYLAENLGLKLVSDTYVVHDYEQSDILYVAELAFR